MLRNNTAIDKKKAQQIGDFLNKFLKDKTKLMPLKTSFFSSSTEYTLRLSLNDEEIGNTIVDMVGKENIVSASNLKLMSGVGEHYCGYFLTKKGMLNILHKIQENQNAIHQMLPLVQAAKHNHPLFSNKDITLQHILPYVFPNTKKENFLSLFNKLYKQCKPELFPFDAKILLKEDKKETMPSKKS